MADPKGVIRALAALGKTGDAALAAQGSHAGAPPGQDLVRVGLMAHIPHQPIFGRIEDIMQRDGEFHGAEVGGEMAAGPGDRVDQKLAQLVRQRRQTRFWQLAQIQRSIDCLLYTSRCV